MSEIIQSLFVLESLIRSYIKFAQELLSSSQLHLNLFSLPINEPEYIYVEAITSSMDFSAMAIPGVIISISYGKFKVN